ncbi:S1 RNA-binding domain-containing protein [Paenibacillus allorhizosphaerae]|uniref:S1 motif domain-containing protein n=1 Tax=Paenibacillus allorhizosphaerae TaxID=2849866 RepID=A0ABM8VNH8_9BACL|nr:S1 RNA-binding domain-containing protein [Paenibacillus allorhizosphaerae]CAG7651203.1 hypothetical protein PAECIP111802_04904 [Paenibacillus allorhizosphaerae]
MLMNNDAILEILRESMIRKYVQMGTVADVKPVTLKGVKDSVIVINFNGVPVYCSREQFTSRKLSSFTGFMGTPVPFLVTDIDRDTGIAIVSRVQAIPIIQQQFLKNVKEGDIVRGTVTGVRNDAKLVFVEVQGVPCMVPPGEWDLNSITDLREVVMIGSEVEVKVTNVDKINKEGDDADSDFEYRIRLSRKEIQKEYRAQKWDQIEQYHSVGDHALAKVVAKTQNGPNTYLIELQSTGIVILGNLQYPLSQQFKYGLPLGLRIQAQITSLDKVKRVGRARIYRIDPTLQTAGAFGSGF